eukprot:scaffold4124_cov378-Prasinococcus_capsulatus_cf.AAC.4
MPTSCMGLTVARILYRLAPYFTFTAAPSPEQEANKSEGIQEMLTGDSAFGNPAQTGRRTWLQWLLPIAYRPSEQHDVWFRLVDGIVNPSTALLHTY